jgi:hypothetical protein
MRWVIAILLIGIVPTWTGAMTCPQNAVPAEIQLGNLYESADLVALVRPSADLNPWYNPKALTVEGLWKGSAGRRIAAHSVLRFDSSSPSVLFARHIHGSATFVELGVLCLNLPQQEIISLMERMYGEPEHTLERIEWYSSVWFVTLSVIFLLLGSAFTYELITSNYAFKRTTGRGYRVS